MRKEARMQESNEPNTECFFSSEAQSSNFVPQAKARMTKSESSSHLLSKSEKHMSPQSKMAKRASNARDKSGLNGLHEAMTSSMGMSLSQKRNPVVSATPVRVRASSNITDKSIELDALRSSAPMKTINQKDPDTHTTSTMNAARLARINSLATPKKSFQSDPKPDSGKSPVLHHSGRNSMASSYGPNPARSKLEKTNPKNSLSNSLVIPSSGSSRPSIKNTNK